MGDPIPNLSEWTPEPPTPFTGPDDVYEEITCGGMKLWRWE